MQGGLGIPGDPVQDLLVGRDLRAGRQLPGVVGGERRLVHDVPGHPDDLDPLPAVLVGGEVVEAEGRLGPRVAGLDPDVAPGVRVHGADMDLVAVAVARRRAVVADGQRQEVEHEVGVGHVRVGADEAAALEVVGGSGPPPGQPLHADPGPAPQAQGRLHRHRPAGGVLDVHLEMILEVLADPRQVGHHRDVQRLQEAGRPHPGELEQLGGSERPGAQQDVPAPDGAVTAPPAVLHPDRPPPLEQDPVDEGAGPHVEVAAAHHRVQVGHRSRDPPSPVNVAVERREPLLAVTVHVLRQLVPGFLHRFEEGCEEGAVGRSPFQHQRALAAPPSVRTGQAGLRTLEVREAVAVVPALHAGFGGPLVIVGRVAPLEDHAVDGAGSAEHLSPGVVDPPTPHVGFGIALVSPVVEAVADGEGQGRRHVDEHVPAVVPAPGFEHQDPVAGVRAQPVGQRAPGRAASHDDEVVQELLLGEGRRRRQASLAAGAGSHLPSRRMGSTHPRRQGWPRSTGLPLRPPRGRRSRWPTASVSGRRSSSSWPAGRRRRRGRSQQDRG